ncbi:MAG: hypothetical protein BWK80_60405 [Desulfobacteraceae bacterium IS3]|nr:MAG: hypothetical protein BWK80_60405 [Desulfobacteraceae bacterium IS3]
MIAECVLALEFGASSEDIARTIIRPLPKPCRRRQWARENVRSMPHSCEESDVFFATNFHTVQAIDSFHQPILKKALLYYSSTYLLI